MLKFSKSVSRTPASCCAAASRAFGACVVPRADCAVVEASVIWSMMSAKSVSTTDSRALTSVVAFEYCSMPASVACSAIAVD
jgi:hypothetical protein